MRDMKEKFGAEVERFRYAFVIPRHIPGWDQPLPESRNPVLPPAPAASILAADAAAKPRRYIEVKPRS